MRETNTSQSLNNALYTFSWFLYPNNPNSVSKDRVPASDFCSLEYVSKYWKIMDTANKIPVPDPMAPIKSAKIDKAPIHIPPNAAAVGM